MTQPQTQYKLGLLQYHFSQQETIPIPAISPPSLLPNDAITQKDTAYTGPDPRSQAHHRIMPNNLDLTIYQAVPTMPDLLSDQAIPTTPYPILDQAIPAASYPILDQAIPATLYPMQDKIMPILPAVELDQEMLIAAHTKKTRILRMVAGAFVLVVALAFYFIWRSASSLPSSSLVTQQNFSGTAPKVSSKNSDTTTNTTANSGGDIQVYIVGAVQHPGVYTLPANARVYQLLLAAGGPLPNANLVALDLAAKLNDGQEVYVIAIGESPPSGINSLSGTPSASSSTGSSSNPQLVNINTASADELRQKLSVSSKTAQTIVSYRQQHGLFTSVDQLSQVVSKSIYDKIKDKVTV